MTADGGYDWAILHDPEVAAIAAPDPDEMAARRERIDQAALDRAMSEAPPALRVLDDTPDPREDPAFEEGEIRVDTPPESESADASDLAAALDAAHAYLVNYVVCPSPNEPIAIVLWIAHAWAADAAETSPYLAVTSAEKRSGKSRLLDVLEQLAPRPWRAVTPSEAVVFRKLAQDHPTLLLDEVDAIFGTRRQADSNEGLRAILNAGNRRGTRVPRIVGEGKKMRVEDFDVFGPKALAGIGKLPDTVADRSIPVRLERRARSEPVARFRMREAEPVAVPIRESLEAHVEPLIDALAHARPDIPTALGDRAADGWEPLLAIADAAGELWAARARAAAVALSSERSDDLDEAPLSILLLADARAIFHRRGVDRLMSSQLVEDLVSDEERPWRDYRDGRSITAHSVSRMLRSYGIRVGRHKFAGSVQRGYRRADFEATWARYLPPVESASDRQPVNQDSGSRTSADGQGAPSVDELTVRTPTDGTGGGDGSGEVDGLPVHRGSDFTGEADAVFGPLGGTWVNGHAATPLPEFRPGPDDEGDEEAAP